MIWRSIISALAIVALTLLSFGHRSADPGAQAQAAAYLLAGVSFSDLCGANGDPSGAHGETCQACIISASCALPDTATEATRVGPYALVDWSAQPSNAYATSALNTALARAPPFG